MSIPDRRALLNDLDALSRKLEHVRDLARVSIAVALGADANFPDSWADVRIPACLTAANLVHDEAAAALSECATLVGKYSRT